MSYDRALIECLLLFLVIWFALVCHASSEQRFAKYSDWQGSIPPVSRTLSWITYGFGIAAIGYLIWAGLTGISIAYLIASPGLLIGMYLLWRRGGHVIDALPVDPAEKKKIRLRVYLYSVLSFSFILGFLFVLDWLGF